MKNKTKKKVQLHHIHTFPSSIQPRHARWNTIQIIWAIHPFVSQQQIQIHPRLVRSQERQAVMMCFVVHQTLFVLFVCVCVCKIVSLMVMVIFFCVGCPLYLSFSLSLSLSLSISLSLSLFLYFVHFIFTITATTKEKNGHSRVKTPFGGFDNKWQKEDSTRFLSFYE